MGFPTVVLAPWSFIRIISAAPVYALQGPDGLVPPSDPPAGSLSSGAVVEVAEGPRQIGGATWYLVMPTPNDATEVWLRVDAPSAVELVSAPCPPAKADAWSMEAGDRLACLGSDPVTVVGQIGHCQGGVVLAEPEWLAHACWNLKGDGFDVALHVTPGSGITFPDNIVRARLTGHFDDPASTTCRYHPDPSETWQAPGPTEQILLCREAFVVDSMDILEVIGTPAA